MKRAIRQDPYTPGLHKHMEKILFSTQAAQASAAIAYLHFEKKVEEAVEMLSQELLGLAAEEGK